MNEDYRPEPEHTAAARYSEPSLFQPGGTGGLIPASSPFALNMSQSPDPAPATNPAILSHYFKELGISRSSLKSVVNKINGLHD